MNEAWKVVPFLCLLLGCTPKPHPTPAPSPSPTVEPTAPPTSSPDPCPSPEPVLAAWKLHPVGRWTDATPLVSDCDYCAEIGLPTLPDGVTPRCDCPVRPEGDPERVACEQEATGAFAWTCPLGGTLVVNASNALQARCDGGQVVRICDQSGNVCAGVSQ